MSKPRIGNIQKMEIMEKGISTVMLGLDLRRVIKRDSADVKFDLVLYPTPPHACGTSTEFHRTRKYVCVAATLGARKIYSL